VPRVVEVIARLVLGGILAGASVAKLASPSSSRAALSTFGIAGIRAQSVAWALLIVCELGLAVGVVAGSAAAAYLAAALMATFALTMIGAILEGRAGAPCACFGARSTVSWTSVGRNALLAVAFAALPSLPSRDLSTDEWLGLGLVVALLAAAGLAVAVLALAREVGMLRLRLGPASALEVIGEGPDVGSRQPVISRFAIRPDTEFALAVFTSRGCHVCHGLAPAIASLANDPILAVETFEEIDETPVWAELEIPGAPYAVAFDTGGRVLAKGTFNNLAQLESVLASAERRRADRDFIEAIGV
jgi:hypothetical protein